MEDEDLLSTLPDEILTHLLSVISPRRAAATSVLSRRWRILWTLAPSLEFDFRYHYWSSRTMKEELARFEKSVDRVLSRNKVTSVRRVKLSCCETDALRASAWLQALAARSSERFDLNLPRSCIDEHSNLNLFPQSFYSSQKNLVELSLTNVVLKIPRFVCFPCLETIKLVPVKFSDDESIQNLLSGCPNLTDLLIGPAELIYKQTLYICSFSLEKLRIRGCAAKVVIDAPKLTYLDPGELRTHTAYDMINIPSLVRVSVPCAADEDVLYGFLGKISHVKELLLLGWRTLSYCERAILKNLRVFYNLTDLTLETDISKECLAILPHILECTPDGVNIVLKLDRYRFFTWKGTLDVPQSISSCIQSVEIYDEKGVPVISCILKTATALKRLSFHGFPTHVFQEYKFREAFLAAGLAGCSNNEVAFHNKCVGFW